MPTPTIWRKIAFPLAPYRKRLFVAVGVAAVLLCAVLVAAATQLITNMSIVFALFGALWFVIIELWAAICVITWYHVAEEGVQSSRADLRSALSRYLQTYQAIFVVSLIVLGFLFLVPLVQLFIEGA